MLNVPTLPPGLSASRHGTWNVSPVTLPTGVAVWRRQRASIQIPGSSFQNRRVVGRVLTRACGDEPVNTFGNLRASSE
eukprot:4350228-Prymnesium_polylepis.1